MFSSNDNEKNLRIDQFVLKMTTNSELEQDIAKMLSNLNDPPMKTQVRLNLKLDNSKELISPTEDTSENSDIINKDNNALSETLKELAKRYQGEIARCANEKLNKANSNFNLDISGVLWRDGITLNFKTSAPRPIYAAPINREEKNFYYNDGLGLFEKPPTQPDISSFQLRDITSGEKDNSQDINGDRNKLLEEDMQPIKKQKCR